MTKYAIERNNAIVNQVVFIGEGLYRSKDVIPLVFESIKKAQEVADVLNGIVVDYDAYMTEDFAIAA
jgi:glycine cleavage system H lipoate-binding protein